MAQSNVMRPIAKDTVHRLCSGQVIVDLSTAVKELLENSLDAGASSVDIKMKESGLASISVADNGQGIPSTDYETLCRKHWTSKLSSFEDLEGVSTFGFRGEALSSLCAVSTVTVTTATQETAPMGIQLEYNTAGELVSQKPMARERGTTIVLTGLFAKWPVRLQDLKKNIKREYMRLVGLVEQYSIICERVRLTLANQSAKGANTVAVRTPPQSTRLSRLLTVFGTHTKPHISHFEYTPDDDSCEGLDLRIDGHISKPIPEAGRSGADKQYFFVNGRPCDFPKAKKLVNELYRGYNPTKYPVFAIAVEINSKSIDVNLTPDKRTILIRHENQLLAAMRAAMVRALEPSESTFRVNKIQTQLYRENSDLSAQSTATLAEDAAATTLGTTMDKGTSIQPGNTEAVAADGPGLALPNEDSGAAVDMAPVVAETSVPGVLRCSYPKGTGKTDSTGESDSVSKKRQSDQVQDLLQPPPSKQPQLRLPPPPPPPLPLPPQKQQARADIERRIPRPMPKLSDGKENNRPTTKSVKRPDTMVIGACLNRVQNVSRDWSAVRERLRQRQELKAQRLEKSQQREAGLDQDLGAESKIGGGISVTDPEEASAALSRLIHKSDFARMAIIGQFNLGFIITRLENDLYIIDQHASDEKYNFEQLQQRMVISSQPLIRPATLELSVIDEGVAIEYKDILMKNGFHVRVDEDALPGRRVSLLSQPFIDQTLFNQNDLMELIGKLCVNPASMPRCDRARRMFASRACRKSIMIGDPLNAAQMRKVVAHLSGLDHPWMCPHARPTALHLFHLPE